MATDPKTLLFDIEAGGLSGKKSSILSIAHATLGSNNTNELYASPVPGTQISKWSQTQVFNRIKDRVSSTRLQLQNEQQILSKFLTSVEQHVKQPGATITGWNIGYVPTQQRPDIQGFDIPMIMTRAKKYGLDKRFGTAFRQATIRDVGQEFAVRMAREVTRKKEGKYLYKNIVDPKLFEQARGYTKFIDEGGFKNASVRAQAEWAGSWGKRFAGWKQEDAHELLGLGKYKAHMAHEDVSAMEGILSARMKKGPELVSNWNKIALRNKLISKAKSGSMDLTQFMEAGGDVPRLRNIVSQSGGQWEDIIQGKGLVESVSKVRGGGFTTRPAASFGQRLLSGAKGGLRFASRNRLAVGMGLGAVALLTTEPLSLFSGKDDEYNTITGLPHGGEAQRMRREMTDFGSGYQGDKNNNLLFNGMIATGGGIAGYAAMYPWEIRGIDLDKYSRLKEIRRVGSKFGMKIVSPSMSSSVVGGEEYVRRSKFGKMAGRFLFGELNPVSSASRLRDFEGVGYMHGISSGGASRPFTPKMVNWGNWDIGVDKVKTWEYAQKHGGSELHTDTIAASKFYRGRGGNASLSAEGRSFLEKSGGLDKVIVKRAQSSLGHGVWLDGSTLPSDVAEEMLHNPDQFLLQKKMDLAGEFRVVTVGDKAVYSVHRFGTPSVQKAGKVLSKAFANVPGLKDIRFSENIQPVLNQRVKADLNAFAEKAAKTLPYEIGAFDIGMTKGGAFKIIEAQRSFGSISNPVVSRRIQNIVTGKGGVASKVASIVGAGAALGIANLFSGKDDNYNTIEGLRHGGEAERMRKELTDFGSGWIRKALSKGISAAKVAKASGKLGQAARVIHTKEGTQWVVTKQLGEGGMGKVFKAQEAGTGRSAIYKDIEQIRKIGKEETLYPAGPAAFSILNKSAGQLPIDTVKRFQKYHKRAGEIFSETAKKYGGMGPAHEIAMQRTAKREFKEAVPEVYGTTKTGFVMESAGRPIREGTQEEIDALKFIERTWGEMFTRRGDSAQLFHFDPSVRNVMIKGGRFQIIDFGTAGTAKHLDSMAMAGSEDMLSTYVSTRTKEIARAMKAAQKTTQHQNARTLRNSGTKILARTKLHKTAMITASTNYKNRIGHGKFK